MAAALLHAPPSRLHNAGVCNLNRCWTPKSRRFRILQVYPRTMRFFAMQCFTDMSKLKNICTLKVLVAAVTQPGHSDDFRACSPGKTIISNHKAITSSVKHARFVLWYSVILSLRKIRQLLHKIFIYRFCFKSSSLHIQQNFENIFTYLEGQTS